MKKPKLSTWFWGLVESLGGDEETMRQRFRNLPRERLLTFRRQYDRARQCVQPIYRPDFLPHLNDHCSEDHGEDFAAWVVSRGRVFFHDVRLNPQAIQRYLDEFDPQERTFVRPDYIASKVFYERFGEEMLLVLYHPELAAKHTRNPRGRR